MPRPAQPPAPAPVRAAGLVLTLFATAAGAAGAASLSTAPAAPTPTIESPATVPAAAVVDDPDHEEHAARAASVRAEVELAQQHEVAAHRAAEAARYAERVKMWDELAECETGGNWYDGGDYGGGLGIYIGTWKMYGGREFAVRPQWATKAQQIIVAERIALDGYGGWGCAHTLGWVN